MATFQALLRVIRALWNIAAPALRWTIRIVLVAILIWPFVVLAIAYAGMTWLTATVAMVPLVAFFILLLIFPLIAGTLAAIPRARFVYKWFLLLVFGEMIVGLYLTFVPVWNDPELIGVLILLGSILGIFLILRRMFEWTNRWATRFAAVLTIGIVVITIIFFFGGREGVMSRFAKSAEIGRSGTSATDTSVITTYASSITPYESLIQGASLRHGVPANLVKAVIRVESNFKPNAESPKGALGLMQVLPSTAKEYGVADSTALLDPGRNIEVGTQHLASLLKRYDGDTELALAAYNSNPGTVDALVKQRGAKSFEGIVDALPAETQAFVPNVVRTNREYASTVIEGQQFTLVGYEEKPTLYAEPGTMLEIQSDKKWIGLSYKPDGSRAPIEMPAGPSRWLAAGQPGHLYVKGSEQGITTLLVRVASR